MTRRGRIVEAGAETIARIEGYERNAESLLTRASAEGSVAPRAPLGNWCSQKLLAAVGSFSAGPHLVPEGPAR